MSDNRIIENNNNEDERRLNKLSNALTDFNNHMSSLVRNLEKKAELIESIEFISEMNNASLENVLKVLEENSLSPMQFIPPQELMGLNHSNAELQGGAVASKVEA